MTDKNLAIWKQVEVTDPQYTKRVNQRGGYNSVTPQYQIKQATKVFGLYGRDWGFARMDFDFQFSDDGIVLVDADFFYTADGEKVTFNIKNAWEMARIFKDGEGNKTRKVDADFAKKAETNTMSKALSKLGFSADVFMGAFDDPNYANEAANIVSLEQAIDKDEEQAKQAATAKVDVDKVIEQIGSASTMSELEGLYKASVRKYQKYSEFVRALTKAKDQKKGELE